MKGTLTLLFLGAFLFIAGRLQIRPRRMEPDDPRWHFDEIPHAEPIGYFLMALGGLLVAAGVTGFVAVWLAEPDDPPLGVLLVFLGAAGIWSWCYDRLYQRLRRPQPTSRWAQLIGAIGRAGKRGGPAILVVGVVVTIAL
jgi:hypothetical protein